MLLKELTTLKVGGEARKVVDCKTEEEIIAALGSAERGLPIFILGGGSNVLAGDAGYEGTIIRPQILGITFTALPDGTTEVVSGAGVVWDELVHAVGERGLWGLENLAAIPGTVGAAPVQNIGAYGAELADTFFWCEVIVKADGSKKRLTWDEAQFAYRDSIFKREQKWIITRVAFRLSSVGTATLTYADLMRAKEEGIPLSTPLEVAAAVRTIRARKLPDMHQYGTAGSFFKNPIIDGKKISLAWILDHELHLKGYRVGKVGLYENQPLVLVTEAGATAAEVEKFADDITQKVFEATGIKIEREVQSLK